MLERNLKAIEISNPSLANKLRTYEYKNIEAFQSQSGDINIAYNNIDLHNDNNPIAEAETIFNVNTKNISVNSINIVYGIGLGYLFKRTYISTPGKIVLYEPFLDVLRFTLQFVDFSKELSDKRVFFCSSIDELLKYVNNKYIVGDDLNIYFLPSYAKLDQDSLQDLTRQIIPLLESKKVDQGTILLLALHWGIVSLRNIENIKKAVPSTVLKDKFQDLPIVIVSAGPSLDENIENLKKYRNKYILLTVNTALKALLSNDIIPDFCVISEIGGIDRQFEGLSNLDQINYILHPRAQKYAWELSKNNYVYFAETDGFSIWYNKILGNKYPLLPTAGSVSILAFYAAILVFKAKNIILVGQDLAFVDNKVYSSSSMQNNEEFKIEDNKLTLKTDSSHREKLFNNLELLKIKNFQGNEILTRKDYYQYINQYEDIIKNELPDNVNIINTSLKGAHIQGMNYKQLDEVLSDFNNIETTIQERIRLINSEYNQTLLENISILDPYIKQFFKESRDNTLICDNLINLAEKFISTYNLNPTDKALIDILNNFYSLKKDLSNFLHQDDLLNFMLQSAYVKFVQQFIMPKDNQPLSIQDQASNLSSELELLKEIKHVFKIIEISRERLLKVNSKLYDFND